MSRAGRAGPTDERDEQADPIAPNTTPTPWHRWRRRFGYAYLLLLVASFITQVFTDRNGPVPADYHVAELTTQTRTGPVTDADERGRVVTPTIQLAYQDFGNPADPAVFLLHGSPGDSTNFERLASRVADAGYRVIVPDLPGFGHSQRWIPDYSNRAHARYLNDLMAKLDIGSAHLVGFSMSGGVILHLYDLYPQRVQSLTLFAAIGIQEGEGSGDYHFEHIKYAVGYAALVGGVEFVPHFGLLGKRLFRHAFLRNFWDTDQRPNREILERYDGPMLIIHGERDPMIPAWTAYEHHRIVEQSELVMYSAADFTGEPRIVNHAMIFTDRGTEFVAEALLPFLERYDQPDAIPVRRTVDHSAGQIKRDTLRLPGDLEVRHTMSPWLKIGIIITATLILEDPASIAVGLFIKAGQLDLFLGVFAVLVGIFIGDLLLYLVGYVVGRRALRWKPIARWVPTRQVDALGGWFDRQGWKAVLASRFIPGTRLPLYVAAGVTGNKPGRFMLWTFLAVSIWVPVILGLVILLGQAARSPFQVLLDRGGWLAFVGVVLVLMIIVNTAVSLLTREGRRRLTVRIRKQIEHEYWPAWRYYLPMIPLFVYLAIRHRSLTVWLLANPGMPDGGVVGESKSDILANVTDPAVLPHALIPRDTEHEDHQAAAAARAEQARNLIESRGWSYPIILKPDAAQRGAGVRRINHPYALDNFFLATPGDVQIQVYHPGPHEAGVFYIRHPEQDTGRIFSITDKIFPVLVGDGKHTLEELIWRHPRYRMQHATFHLRFVDRLQHVLADGETLRLAEAGNHAQGCMFKDGSHLITPQLEQRIDQLAHKVDGFYFGRIDVRYTDAESFKRGENLAIIEINGVTSESTNIYDPAWNFLKAQRILWRQWTHCWEIGAANRRRGMNSSSAFRLLRDILKYYRDRKIVGVSD